MRLRVIFFPIVDAFYDMKILPYFDLPSRLKRDSAFLGKCGLVINSHDLAGQKVSSRAFAFLFSMSRQITSPMFFLCSYFDKVHIS